VTFVIAGLAPWTSAARASFGWWVPPFFEVKRLLPWKLIGGAMRRWTRTEVVEDPDAPGKSRRIG
jgi:hypothetical protein